MLENPRTCSPSRWTCRIGRISSVHYLYASGWAGDQSLFYPFFEKTKTRGWTTSEVDCWHDVMIYRPDVVTTLLCSSLASAENPSVSA